MAAFWRHTYHLVWATHCRAQLISDQSEPWLHHFLADKARELKCEVWAVNGMADHVHMVVGIPPALSVSEMVHALKGASSHAMNANLAPNAPTFAWQRGFGSLTVSHGNRAAAIAYVENQKQHHAEQKTNHWLEECGGAE